MDWRNAVLLSLLAALELVFLGDALVLGWRRRRVAFWAVLVLTVVVVPLAVVVSMARIDLWRYEQPQGWARPLAAAATLLAIGAAYLLRRRLWRQATGGPSA